MAQIGSVTSASRKIESGHTSWPDRVELKRVVSDRGFEQADSVASYWSVASDQSVRSRDQSLTSINSVRLGGIRLSRLGRFVSSIDFVWSGRLSPFDRVGPFGGIDWT